MVRLRKKIGQAFGFDRSSSAEINSVIETDFLQNRKVDGRVVYRPHKTEEPSEASDADSGASPPLLQSQCSVNATDWHSVVNALQSKLHAWSRHPQLSEIDVLLPHGMVDKVAKDLVRLASSEPTGLDGMCIHVNLQRKLSKQTIALGVIQYNSQVTPAFELHLTLIEDKKKWFHLRDLFAPVLPGCLVGGGKEEVYISPGFMMEKKRLSK
ncbi:hypothetical protein CAPTEDRAFT_186269 [Capitella teleta]|uniref:Uncharacterized protein n=1 Tax=Capitella teleta TaxID=283909 RepID=R7V8Y9_CAPTE|nr:hypothetical protein CAPTEDRAFT_186269 [Capitella teleta]|eukprot:ELU14982.1 hypothetical protein CAPTEDRAFT_186269 [Capitella teleta]